MKSTETTSKDTKPTLADHPGLHNDEAMDAGKKMTASGSTASARGDSDGEGRVATEPTTLDDHPGLHNDESTEEGKMMTASGSHSVRVPDAEDGSKERS